MSPVKGTQPLEIRYGIIVRKQSHTDCGRNAFKKDVEDGNWTANVARLSEACPDMLEKFTIIQ